MANARAKAQASANINAVLLNERERANITIVGERGLLKDPTAIDLKTASTAYQYLAGIIQSSVQVRDYGLKPGESETPRGTVKEFGKEIKSFTYDDVYNNRGGGTTVTYDDGSKDVDVTVGGGPPVEGVDTSTIPNPESIVFAHEVYGHGTGGDAVTVENQIRASVGLPFRSGADHELPEFDPANPPVVNIDAPADLIPAPEIQLNEQLVPPRRP